MKKVFLYSFLLILITSCGKHKTISEEIIGKWSLVDIKDGEYDINKERNPKGDRIIEFHKDGTYFSKSSGYTDRTGNWNLDTMRYILNMKSDWGPGDDSRWKVILKEDTFITRGKTPLIRTVKAKWIKIETYE